MHHDAHMRTTIDLPDDLHAIAGQLAQIQRTSLSAVVADLMRRALMPQIDASAGKITADPATGFPTLRSGSGPITPDMVRQSQDDD
jgi:Arc/MetJ family transcription regulator